MPLRAENPPIELSVEQHRALADVIARFAAPVRTRGRRYARAGRVGEIDFDGERLVASVEGSEAYTTEWSFTRKRWRGVCSCPVASRCKHLFALAQEALAGNVARIAAGGKPRSTATAPRARTSLVDRIAARDAPARAASLADEIGAAIIGSARPIFPALPLTLREPDPELRVWRVARLLVDAGAAAIPAELAAWAERDDLEQRLGERRGLALFEALESWAGHASVVPSKRLRFELCFADPHARSALFARVRLRSSRIADEPRSGMQLVALLRETDTRPGVLAAAERELARFLLEGGFLESLPYEYAGRVPADDALLARAAATPLVRIQDDLDAKLAARTGLVPGGRVPLDPEPARLAPVVERGARGPELHVRCILPDGSALALDEAWLAPERARGAWIGDGPRLLAARGRFFRVIDAPSRHLLDLAGEIGSIALGGPELRRLRRVAGGVPALSASLAPFVRTLRVTPLVLLDLLEDDWLDARLVAHTGPRDWQPSQPPPDGARMFEVDAEGAWRERNSTFSEDLAGSAGSGLEEPEAEDLAPAVRWLESVDADGARETATGRASARYRCIRVTTESLDALSRAVDDARREEVGVYTSARLGRLLRGGNTRLRASVRASGIDFFEVDASWEDELAALSDDDRARLRASGQTFVRLRRGWVRRAQAAEDDALLDAFADLGVAPGEGARRIGLLELAGAHADSLATLERLAGDAEAVAQARRLRERVASFKGLPHVKLPAGLRVELRPYQHAGLDFLSYLSSLGLGALLADDMGLGKTVQALAWLLHLRELEPRGGPSLVVCPTSVVHGWAREAARFAPALRVVVLESGNERAARRRELARCDLAITSYALLRRDLADWRDLELRAAILDEAQQVKNPDAVGSRAVRELRARHRLVLTGTPLENRPLDLWSLSEFANPGYLGARKQFVARFDRTDAPPHARRLLSARLRPVLLRRLKRNVAPELPERIEERRDCELSREQRKRYAVELERARAVAAAPADTAQALAQKRIAILAALLRLRQIACHPALAGGSPEQSSGKLDALLELVEPLVAEGHKVLVFSQFVRFLELVEPALARRGIRSHVLTGATTRRERVIAAFQSDSEPCVFLISLKAGGAGLNLTAARYVVLLDPWWNPAVEAQAIDRTHRIGQDRTVVAYRLVARDTIEEKVLALQEAKQALVQDVLGDEAFARSLSREVLEELFAE